MNEVGSSFYHFDRIRINSEKSIKTLKDQLPIKELEQECYSFMIRKPYATASDMGNKSSVEIVVASQKALDLLRKHDSILGSYAITSLEITKDTFRESEREAVSEAREKYGTISKLWSRSSFVFDPHKKADYVPEEGYYETPTIYLGRGNIQYVMYARPSKLNGKPCAHEEWKLKSPSTIKKITKISTIRDFVLFDTRTFTEERNERLLRNDKEIDLMKLGKWLTDCSPRQKKFSDRKRKSVQSHATAYCAMWGIYSFENLKQHFRTEKMEIKKKNGRRNAFENKIMDISNYSKFARQING